MENYMNNYEQYQTNIIYDFKLGCGGIGDCIKFFMHILELCMKNNEKLYYKINNIELEKYLILKHKKMYILNSEIEKLQNVKIVEPKQFYNNFNDQFSIKIDEVFDFPDIVKLNCKKILPFELNNYISIHLRLGDKHLEVDKKYIRVKFDVRNYSNDEIYKFIENNSNKIIFFCCDNNTYKLKLKEKYENIVISNCKIGHSDLNNTKPNEILDAVTEFYILTNSELIYGASRSGFSSIASKFRNISFIENIT